MINFKSRSENGWLGAIHPSGLFNARIKIYHVCRLSFTPAEKRGGAKKREKKIINN